MRNLVRRYVTVEQRKAENQGVTEDDVNEIKQDISAFRFELIEILKNSGMNTSTAHSSMGTGGKKNRQKERRLMKGFNIAPQPSTTATSSPPESLASLPGPHHESHHYEFFGSTISGIFNSTPRKLLQHSSTVSSSQGNISDGHGHHHRGFGRLHLKRSHSHKRRWGTLIEAAKTAKVSRLIGRSRSEDSVCNNCTDNGHNHSHSNSPASDENESMSQSDSNPSIDVTMSRDSEPAEPELHGLAHGLALLKKKRKKFSASRNTSPVVVPPTSISETISKKLILSKKFPQVLKRASSVPTRVPEVNQLPVSRHEKAQSQQDSIEIAPASRSALTSSTTEESVTHTLRGSANANPNDSFKEPLIYTSSSSNPATGSTQTPDEEFKTTGQQSLPKLPGVIPLMSGQNNAGWL